MDKNYRETINKRFGLIMREARQAKKMTMKQLGEKIGYSEGAVSHFELGEREVPLVIFMKICVLLDLDVNDVQKELLK